MYRCIRGRRIRLLMLLLGKGLVFHPYFLNLSSLVIKMALIIFLRLSDGHSLALSTFFLINIELMHRDGRIFLQKVDVWLSC
jgi:hypothetical protein